MPDKLKPFFDAEILAHKKEILSGNFSMAWHHLERTHVIGQEYPWQHIYAHWKMLQFGFMIKDNREIIGQLPRLLVVL